MVYYYISYFNKSGNNVRGLGRFYVTLDEARKIACAKLKENPQYNVVIAKYTDSGNKTLRKTISYSSEKNGFYQGSEKINPKTGKIVGKKTVVKSDVPKYFAYSDVDDEITFRDNDLNRLRKSVLKSPRYTFMYVIDARTRKEVGIVEIYYRAWRTPTDNWYDIKSDGSLGSRTRNQFQ